MRAFIERLTKLAKNSQPVNWSKKKCLYRVKWNVQSASMKSATSSEYAFFGFICTKCNYRCERRNDLQKHFATQKHARMAQRGLVLDQPIVVSVAPSPKLNADSMHECMCGKAYRHLSSLCKHRRKCDYFQDQMEMTRTSLTDWI